MPVVCVYSLPMPVLELLSPGPGLMMLVVMIPMYGWTFFFFPFVPYFAIAFVTVSDYHLLTHTW